MVSLSILVIFLAVAVSNLSTVVNLKSGATSAPNECAHDSDCKTKSKCPQAYCASVGGVYKCYGTSCPKSTPTSIAKPTAAPTTAPAGNCGTGYHCTAGKTIDILDGCSTVNPVTGAPGYACHQHSHPFTVTCNSKCTYDLGIRQIMCKLPGCTTSSGAEISGNCCVKN